MRCVGFDSILRRDETDHMPSKQVMRDDIEMSHHTTPRSSIASKWKKDGYSLLAELMSNVPELSILRSFNELHLLNLFRIQAELQELESDLETIHEIDGAATQEEIRNFVRNFALMRESKEEDSRQYNKLIEISAKLEEYGHDHWHFNPKVLADFCDRLDVDQICSSPRSTAPIESASGSIARLARATCS